MGLVCGLPHVDGIRTERIAHDAEYMEDILTTRIKPRV